jgi:hypothetical protein
MEKLKVDEKYEINDIRSASQFKGISFSEYKKTEVKKAFEQNMIKGKIEPSCYWCAELICAGHYVDIWETILHYVGKHIHLANPKLIIYLQIRYSMFRNIMSQNYYDNELQFRNNSNIRKLFGEIICMITMSNKKHSFEPIKINRLEEFDITQMPERLKAPSIRYVEKILKKDDPKELMIAVNEFMYNISPEVKNMSVACYWIEWVIEFDIICKNKKIQSYCERRAVPVENKFQCDIIWILWDAIHSCVDEMNNTFIKKIMDALMDLFCIKYTSGACKKRRYLLYYAVALITEPVPTNVELIQNKSTLQNVIDKIDDVYKQIKKNEHSPNTDYLFSNLEKQNNFEKSVKKMEMLQTMDLIPRNNNP